MQSKRKPGRPPKMTKDPRCNLTLRGDDYEAWKRIPDDRRKFVRDALSEMLSLMASTLLNKEGELGYRCDSCKERKHDVSWTACPFSGEVDNAIVMRWLCQECFQQFADDI